MHGLLTDRIETLDKQNWEQTVTIAEQTSGLVFSMKAHLEPKEDAFEPYVKMRNITAKEWDKLVRATDGNDKRIHWKGMFSHVGPRESKDILYPSHRLIMGCIAPNHAEGATPTARSEKIGFRPTVRSFNSEVSMSGIKEGDTAVIGTLYMNGKPVPVPETPTYDGDITTYSWGAELEMRRPIDDPHYQVIGIYIGDGVFAADRNLLKHISSESIYTALNVLRQKEMRTILSGVLGVSEKSE